jgi:lysophospholipase L1-like esterase
LGNLKSIFDVCRAHNVSRILSVGIPDSAFLLHDERAMNVRNEVNAGLKSYARRNGDFATYVDCPVSYKKVPYDTDGLHFADETYSLLGQRLFPQVKAILGQI